MNRKQFRYAQVLSEEGSFSRAAEVLGISQPSLSQYIKKIEKELGQLLFDRTNGDVRLTDAGRIYIETGKRILELEHRMEGQLSDLQERKTGSIIIGTAPYRAAGMLPQIAAAFREVHPGMHLVVREGTTAELIEGMEHGEYDLCLTLAPADARLFEIRKVAEEELVFAVPGSWPEIGAEVRAGRKHPAVDVRQMDGCAFVQLMDTQFMQKQLETLVMEHRLGLRTAVVVKSLEAQIEMVKAGVGAALVPSGIERFCRPGEVRFYSIAQAVPPRQVVLMWRKDRKLTCAAEELKDLILTLTF